jgi:hypothetical protein
MSSLWIGPILTAICFPGASVLPKETLKRILRYAAATRTAGSKFAMCQEFSFLHKGQLPQLTPHWTRG